MFKVRFYLWLLLVFPFSLCGQVNLVPNPGFEILNSCSSGPSAIYNHDSPPWESPSDNTADVFDTCSIYPAWAVPSNFGGYQLPHNGHGYAGACFYPSPEYLEIELDSAMIANKTYCVSFYVNLGGKVRRATKNTGMYISSAHIYTPTLGYLNYSPQIIDTTFITDTINWTLISGQYTAIGGERYISIGKFSNAAGDTIHVNSSTNNPIAYYYIDDVDIHCCNCDSELAVGDLSGNNRVVLYPDPADNYLMIDNNLQKSLFTIVNIFGQNVIEGKISGNDYKIEVGDLPSGIYFLILNGEEYYKFIISH